jgi:hypothetical protein
MSHLLYDIPLRWLDGTAATLAEDAGLLSEIDSALG